MNEPHPPVPVPPGGAFLTDLRHAGALATFESRPVLVHFTASWCEPCRRMKDEVYTRPEVRRRLARFVRVEVDVEGAEGKKAWMDYAVGGLPTVSFLGPDLREAKELRLEGFQDEAAMTAGLDRAIGALSPPATSMRERVALREPIAPPASPGPLEVDSSPIPTPRPPVLPAPLEPAARRERPAPGPGPSWPWWAGGAAVALALAVAVRRALRGGGASRP